MKVVYAKSIGERIDDAISAAERDHKRIDRIELWTLEAVQLFELLKLPGDIGMSLKEFLDGGNLTYRGVPIALQSEE